DVRLVLSDRRFSRSAYTSGPLFARSADSLPLITTDAPVHTRRRSTVAPPFTAHQVGRLRPMVVELARRQLAEYAAGGRPADVVGRFTVPFTLRVMCRIMAVPEEDMPRFGPWVDVLMSIDKFPAEQVERCHREMQEYFAALVDTVQGRLDRGEEVTGLIARMLTPTREDRRLSRTEAVVLSAGMLMAGYETTSNVLAAVLHQILRRPELVGRILADPAEADPIIEETLRYVCANGSGGVPHVALTDVTLSDGSVVTAGEVVVPVPDAANRDPLVFDRPDQLDPDRVDNPHIAFGYGAHHCLGAELARLEADMRTVSARIAGAGATIDEAVAALDADPARTIQGKEAFRDWMQALADRTIDDLHGLHFDIPEQVRRIECRLAPTSDGAIYYTGPSEDFSRPGRMWWAVPQGITEFSTWREVTTVFHEGAPGHHLQIGQTAVRADRLNRWQRLLCWISGHGEGWALYAERLMDELGYLEDPGDKLGMLDGQAFRAARVIVDIGMHLELTIPKGNPFDFHPGERWTPELGWEFMRAHCRVPDENLRFELNRYLGRPGQAPAYKVGERIWLQAREDAKIRKGPDFDLKEFHQQALDLGALGLDPLRQALARL
ncbi:DUF885 family protein, partial [Micromonospora fluostatini]